MNDEDLYQGIFRIQEDGHWRKADRLIARLDDPLLLGHILAQRFLHPTKYRSRYKELKDWMAIYSDHPDAERLYKLALRRKRKNWRNPKPPHASGSQPSTQRQRPVRSRVASLAALTG